MENKTLFKVAQTVYDSALFGDLKGEVKGYKSDTRYKLIVEFNGKIFYYTLDGRFNVNMNPTLSNQPYKVEYVPPQPQIELPEVGQMCYFWNENPENGFIYAQFGGYDSRRGEYRFFTKNESHWQYCSTTNPVEDGK